MIWAALDGETEATEFLLKHGIDINAKTNDGNTALMLAVKYGHAETAALLRYYGAEM